MKNDEFELVSIMSNNVFDKYWSTNFIQVSLNWPELQQTWSQCNSINIVLIISISFCKLTLNKYKSLWIPFNTIKTSQKSFIFVTHFRATFFIVLDVKKVNWKEKLENLKRRILCYPTKMRCINIVRALWKRTSHTQTCFECPLFSPLEHQRTVRIFYYGNVCVPNSLQHGTTKTVCL